MKMKKRINSVFLISCLALYAVGCGMKAKEAASDITAQPDMAESIKVSEEIKEADEIMKQEEADSGDIAANQTTATASAATKIDMVSLPEGIKGLKAEAKSNKELQKLIIEYYEIPEDFYEATRYYYNYVDLNGDGEDEIFVVVMGPYTSGTGGDSALWVVESAGKLHVNQDFMLINTPVIVSDTVTNGVKELVVPYYGGGAKSQYAVLACSDGFYSRVADGKMIDSLDGITGEAIIANNMIKEIEAGNMGFNLLSE
jgi:hypothetical protein